MKDLPIPPDQDVFHTALVLGYEVGSIYHALIYSKRRPYLKEGYMAECRLALSDSFAMLRVLSQQLGFRPGELIEDGEERLIERIQEIVEWAKQ